MHSPLCLFEDNHVSDLWPFAQISPLVDLWWGTGSLFDHIQRRYEPEALSLWVRAELAEVTKQRHPEIRVNTPNLAGPLGFVNARAFWSEAHHHAWNALDKTQNHVMLSEGEVVAVLVQPEHVSSFWALIATLPDSQALREAAKHIQAIPHAWDTVYWMRHPWDLIKHHESVLQETLSQVPTLGRILGQISEFVRLRFPEKISIASEVTIEDFVWINAEKGPVVIESGVHIEAGTRLEGPLYIGPGTRLMGGKISFSSIGPGCKLAGEISNSLWMGYANKAHQGYIGHSVLGEWVNLGAMTTTSNLKNTYDSIQIKPRSGGLCDTHLTFLGSLIGEHTKTGIGTLLNTGTLVGIGCNIIGAQLHHGSVPDFKWGESNRYQDYRLDKFLTVAKTAMARRNIVLSEAQSACLSRYYEGRIK